MLINFKIIHKIILWPPVMTFKMKIFFRNTKKAGDIWINQPSLFATQTAGGIGRRKTQHKKKQNISLALLDEDWQKIETKLVQKSISIHEQWGIPSVGFVFGYCYSRKLSKLFRACKDIFHRGVSASGLRVVGEQNYMKRKNSEYKRQNAADVKRTNNRGVPEAGESSKQGHFSSSFSQNRA